MLFVVLQVRYARLRRMSTHAAAVAKPSGSSATKPQKENYSDSMTMMLVVITTTFVLLTTPFYIWVNGQQWWSASNNLENSALVSQTYFAYAVTYHLLEFNFSVNFILYCIFGKRFRSAVGDLFGRCGGQGNNKSRFSSSQITKSISTQTELDRISTITE